MYKDPGKEFTIWGDLRIEGQKYQMPVGQGGLLKGAQVLCFADVSWNHLWFSNVLLLKLDIYGNQEDGWKVRDDYPEFLPFMRAVDGFRNFIRDSLDEFRSNLDGSDKRSPDSPLWMGVGKYMGKLRDFDEVHVLLQEASSFVSHLKQAYSKAEASAEKVRISEQTQYLMEVFGLPSKTKEPFLVRGPML